MQATATGSKNDQASEWERALAGYKGSGRDRKEERAGERESDIERERDRDNKHVTDKALVYDGWIFSATHEAWQSFWCIQTDLIM